MSGELKTHLPGASKGERRWLYRCERTADWGLGVNGGLIAGLTLVPVPGEREEGVVDDPLGLELGEGLLDARIVLPNSGLREGAVYQMLIDSRSSDWESSIPDSALLRLVLVAGGAPAARDEAAELRAALDDAAALLKRIDDWEGSVILSDEVWATSDGMPKLTRELYDQWIELQDERNRVRAALAASEGQP